MSKNDNYYSPSMLNIDGTLVTVSCRSKAGKDYGYVQLVCERQRTDKDEAESTVICAPPARVVSDDANNDRTSFFTTPATALTKEGDIIMLSAFFPESKGGIDKKLLEKKKIAYAYHDGKRYPLIYDRGGNFYYVLDDGSVLDKRKQPTDYTVKSFGQLYSGSEYLGNIYLNGAQGKDDAENHTTHGAPLKAPKRSYIMMFRSSDGGKTWSAPTDITAYILNEKDSPYLVAASGTALTTESGRLIFTLRTEKENICIYTDDGGKTWGRNQRQPYAVTQGYWVAFQTPNHQLRAVGCDRGKLSGGISPDNGIVWIKGDKPKFKTGDATFGCLVTDDKVFVSHPAAKGNSAGIVIGDFTYDKKDRFKGVLWRKEEAALKAAIGDSTLAKIDDETIAIAYEDTAANDIKIEFIKLQ